MAKDLPQQATLIQPAMRKLTEGEKAIRWIEKYVYMFDGPEQNKPVKLADFQKQILIEIFDNPKNPSVRVRKAILTMGRKNGKSATAAFITLYLMMSPAAERNSLIVSAARSLDQAVYIYEYAVKSILYSPVLRTQCRIKESKKEIYVPRLGTKFKSLSAGDAGTKMGMNPRVILFDETGQVRGSRDRLIEALESSQGAQPNALQIHLSTQAEKDTDMFSVMIDDALAGHDPSVVIKMWSAPEDMDPFSEEALAVANPAWNIWITKGDILREADAARRIVSRRGSFQNLYLNQRIAAEEKWIAPAAWMACASPVADWQGQDVYLGIDYSKTTDITSMAIVFQPGREDKVHIASKNWMPADTIRERAAEDETEYDIWAKQGIITAIPGATINPDDIASFIKEIHENANIKKIAFDRWRFDEVKRSMIRLGVSERWIDSDILFEFGQGTKSMDPALNLIEQYILAEMIAHGSNPLLNMAVNNVRIDTNQTTALRKPVKGSYNRRVDPIIAVIMGLKAFNDFRDAKPKTNGFRLIG